MCSVNNESDYLTPLPTGKFAFKSAETVVEDEQQPSEDCRGIKRAYASISSDKAEPVHYMALNLPSTGFPFEVPFSLVHVPDPTSSADDVLDPIGDTFYFLVPKHASGHSQLDSIQWIVSSKRVPKRQGVTWKRLSRIESLDGTGRIIPVKLLRIMLNCLSTNGSVLSDKILDLVSHCSHSWQDMITTVGQGKQKKKKSHSEIVSSFVTQLTKKTTDE
jgi:hypothetical protein